MKKCPKCNREIENNSVCCEYCECKTKKSIPLWMIVASLVFGIGIGMLVIPIMKDKDLLAEASEKEPSFQGPSSVVPVSVSVWATKMNVVYRGIDNPIAVSSSAGGEITAMASSGSLTRTGNGTYNLRPGEGNEETISVSSNGSCIGSMKFRVKDVPKPTVFIRNVVNGQVSKSALQAAGRVEAEVKDFDFEDARFDVVGYSFFYMTKSGVVKEVKTNGGAFTDEIRTAISQANVGDMFLFTAIQVRGNDGKVKTLESDIGVLIK